MTNQRLSGAAGLLLLMAISVFAADPQPTPMPGTYVHDFAGVISAEKREEINAKAKALKDNYKTEIGLVTIQSLNGEEIFDYSLRMARDWGIGSKDNDIRGLLIVVSVGDRKIGFRTSRHIEPEITDGIAGTINRTMGQYFKRGDWGGGLSAGMDAILAREKEVFEPAPAAAQPAPSGGAGLGTLLLALLGGGIVAGSFVVFLVRRSRRRARVNVPRPADYYSVPERYSSPVRPLPPSYGSRPSSSSRTRTGREEEYISIPTPVPDPSSYSRASAASDDDDSSPSPSYSSPSSSPSTDSGSSYSGGSDMGGGGADTSF